MLKHIHIRNFQSLRKLHLELGKFTVIVGDSDVGKSAVIRAIEAVVNNTLGQGMITGGTKASRVLLAFDDVEILWAKEGASARYVITTADGPETYDKPGRSVPADVAIKSRLGIITVGGEKINLNVHGQFDLPFLVSSKPLERARLLGEITGLNIIHLAMSNVRGRVQSAKSLQTTRSGDVSGVKTQLNEFKHLPKIKAQLAEQATAIIGISNLEGKSDLLVTAVDDLVTKQEYVTETQRKADKARDVLGLVSPAIQAAQDVEFLANTVAELTEHETKYDQLHKRSLASISIIEQVESIQTKVDSAQILSDNISDLIEKRDALENSMGLEAIHENEVEAFEGILSDIEFCPTCDQHLAEGIVAHLEPTSV